MTDKDYDLVQALTDKLAHFEKAISDAQAMVKRHRREVKAIKATLDAIEVQMQLFGVQPDEEALQGEPPETPEDVRSQRGPDSQNERPKPANARRNSVVK